MFMNETRIPGAPQMPASRSRRASDAGLAASPAPSHQYASERRYAGFWLRFLAYLIDSVIILIPMSAIYGVLYYFASRSSLIDEGSMHGARSATSIGTIVLLAVVPALLALLYLAVMESSECQATFGKLALGLKVTDLQGNRISFCRAIGRELGKIVSSQTFCIGFIVAGFSDRKQALHDILARTLVLSTRKV
jgi:uncharacterized RDD family membrane protein YckC